MSEDVNIIVKTTIDPGSEAELKDYENRIKKTRKSFRQLKEEMRKQMPSMVGAINAMISMARNFIRAAGIILDDTLNAFLDGIQAGIMNLMSLAVAWNMIPGVGQMVFLAVSAAVMGIGIGTTAAMMQKAEANKANLAAAEAGLRNIETITRAIGGLF